MSEPRGRLSGRVAIVTGAGSGIGRAIALGYAREGARVLAADLNGPAAEATAREGGGAILAHAVDVTDEPATRAMVAAAVGAFGRLDVLVNSAAIQLHGQDGRCHEVDLEVWERTLRVNLRGPFLCCKHALPELIRSRGTIVNLASPTAFGSLGAGYTAYASSKGGMKIREPLVARTPLGRLGRAEDLVGIAIFLASDDSAYATGALFFVDGGITMA
jgi:NAD(P)-dependent dehydrogenase (short-subunit alcohol dehydrogenase family)